MYIFLFFLFVATFIFFGKKPLFHYFSISNTWDLLGGTLSLLLFLLLLASEIIIPKLLYEESASLPCGPASPQALCYNLKSDLCHTAWNGFESTCKSELADEIKARGPSGLVGPVITKCRMQKFDQFFKYNRKNNQSLLCSSYFGSLED